MRQDPEALEDLIRLHGMVWSTRGQKGYFAGRDGFSEFFRILLPPLLARGAAAFFTVEVDGAVAATTIAFFTRDQSCAYLSGRDPAHELKKYSPGKALLYVIIRKSMQDRLASCDLMEGLTEYKFRVGGQFSWFSRYTMFKKGLGGLQGRTFLSILSLRKIWTLRRVFRRRSAIRRHGE
jgi:CelD/BcsL family acetyltransferase involved in cellulose biosynthesis